LLPEDFLIRVLPLFPFLNINNQFNTLFISILFSILKNSNDHYHNFNYYFLQKMMKNACESGKNTYFCKMVMHITVMIITIL